MKAATVVTTILTVLTAWVSGLAADYDNSPGWTWFLAPVPVSPGAAFSRGGVLAIIPSDVSDGFSITIGWQPSEGTAYRAVAIDGLGHRYLPDGEIGPGNEMMSMTRYSWTSEAVPPRDIMHIGFEMLTPDGWPVASRHALQRAKEAGVEVLPYPEVGKPFQFHLTTIKGERMHSRDLLGTVVVVNCWATWCTPCMQKIPRIKALQEQTKGRATVIGINFDHDPEKYRKALDEKDIDWPTVHVPGDAETRVLWFEASSIRMLPRLIVLDQHGVVRLDTRDANEVERTVIDLTATPK